jgi:hypothetical protein
MLARFASTIALFFSFTAFAHATLSADHVQLGEQRPGRQVSGTAVFENDSGAAVTILRQVHSSGDTIRARRLPLIVPAHGSAELTLDVDVYRLLGKQVYYVEFDLDSEQKSLRVVVNLFVDSAIDGEPTSVDFGLVPAGKQVAARRVALSSRDIPDLRARTATDASSLLDAQIVDDGKAILLRTRQNAPWGKHQGWIEVSTTSTKQPTAWIRYSFETRGRVVPETYAVNAGVQKAGSVQPQMLFVRDIEGSALELGTITQRGAPVLVHVTDCPMKQISCRALEMKVDDQKVKDARFSTQLTIDLPQYGQELVVSYSGILLPHDGQVVDLNSLAGQQSSDVLKSKDLTAALQSATQPSSITMPTPEGQGPLLQWNVENEQRFYGYIIYRADVEGGQMRRVNEKIIGTLSQEDNVPVKYYWRDTTAKPGHTYWYQIGTVDQRDVRADLTPRVKKAYSSEAVSSK